jgi:Rrf2 family protein
MARRGQDCPLGGVQFYMVISNKARYALKVMFALGRLQRGESLQRRQLCEQEGLPYNFADSVLQALKVAGFIHRCRNNSRGYELVKPLETITVGQVVRCIDGPIIPPSCLSKTAYIPCKYCNSPDTCEFRLAVRPALEAYEKALDILPLRV